MVFRKTITNPKMSKQEPVKINKNEPVPIGMDFVALKKEGIDIAQELSGDVWTDYNEHDPGITILENQIYALTELSYKANFEVEDIYFSNPDIKKDTDHLFYQLEKIMVCSPLTSNDYRKLIIDQVFEAKNAWVLPKTQSESGFDMKGVFEVFLQVDGLEESQQIISKVSDLLAANRNLGEDFETPKILQSEKIAVQAGININSDMIGESILATVLFRLSELFNPRVGFHTMEEMLQMGLAYEDFFQGPLPVNGFITEADLEKSDLAAINRIYRSKIVQCITNIEGVIAVTNLQMLVGNTIIAQEFLQLDNKTYPVLDIEKMLQQQDFITLFVGDIPYSLDLDLVRYSYDMLITKERQSHKRWLDFKVYEPESQKDVNEIEFYYSIQNTFPLIYGIGEFGVALKPNREEYLAYSRQMKAYLTPMDQLMANYLSQLVNVPKLLSIDRSVDHTYFSQVVDTAADMEKVYIYPRAQHEEKLRELVAVYDKYVQRRNRFLDHLLARFGDEFLSEAYHSIHRESTSLSKGEFAASTLEAKMKYLENYVEISSNRAKGFNYRRPHLDSENTAGLKKKVSLMFNMTDYSTRKLGNSQFNEPNKAARSKTTPGSGNTFNFISGQENVIAEALAYGISRLNYHIQNIGKEGYQILFVNPVNKEQYDIYHGKTLLECEDALKKLMLQLKEINKQCEGFHLVEHVLLRPTNKAQTLIFSDGISQLLYAVGTAAEAEWATQLAAVGGDKKFYKILKNDKLFELQLVDAKDKLIANNPSYTSKKLAENAMLECMKLFAMIRQRQDNVRNHINEEQESTKGILFTEDPYSLKMSFLIPAWSGRFLQDKMRTIFENISRLNAPAHLTIDFHWLNPKEMNDFEAIYFKWLQLKSENSDAKKIDAAAYHVIAWLRSKKKPNNKDLKKELDNLS